MALGQRFRQVRHEVLAPQQPQHCGPHPPVRVLGEGTKRIPQRRPVQIRRPDLREQALVEQPLAAIAREEPQVLQLRFGRLGPHLEIPAARQDDLAGPAKREVQLRPGEQVPWLDVHNQRNVLLAQHQEVGHVAAPTTVDGGGQQERLGEHGRHVLVEVGVEQPRQLKPGLVDDVAAHGGRPIRAGIVLLSVPPAERTPRHRRLEHVDARVRPDQVLVDLPVCATETHRDFADHTRHTPPPSSASGETDIPVLISCDISTIRLERTAA